LRSFPVPRSHNITDLSSPKKKERINTNIIYNIYIVKNPLPDEAIKRPSSDILIHEIPPVCPENNRRQLPP